MRNCKTVQKIAEHLRAAIEKTNFMEVDQVTCSFGILCNFIKSKEDIKNLLKKADKALYIAKSKGKNKVKVLT
jgi:diguanylate cyclase (GGDEF)-like protein